MLVIAKNPVAKFNAGVKDGSSGKALMKILEELNPEAVYFTELEGRECRRGCRGTLPEGG